jgi:hypothetical protein
MITTSNTNCAELLGYLATVVLHSAEPLADEVNRLLTELAAVLDPVIDVARELEQPEQAVEQ